MIEWLDANILYWHWIVIGLFLIILELFAPVFVVLWLGLAAIIVGLLLTVFDINVSIQLVTWAVLSTAFLLLWHKYVSPKITDQTLAGLSRKPLSVKLGW